MKDRFTDGTVFTNVKKDNLNVHSKSTSISKTVDILNNGSEVKVLSEDDDWYEVRTEKGYYGYVEKKHTDEELVKIEYDKRVKYVGEQETENERINITWEYVYEKTPDITDEDKMQGLDVVIPTWFSLAEEGVIINKADFNYVANAHENGYKI